jgi:hypothetical protein
MSSTRCDAITSSGQACKNSGVGEVDGRQYCRIASHEGQIRALAASPEEKSPEAHVAAEPEPVEAVDTPVDTSESPAPEVEEWALLLPPEPAPFDATHTCPSCGEHRGLITAAIGGDAFQASCRACAHTWVA